MNHATKKQKMDAPPLDDHLGFVDAILKIMAQSAKASGSRSTDVIAEEIAKRNQTKHDRVAKSRFLLGADDGSYLRQAVMPLQTSEPGIGCDDKFSLGPTRENNYGMQEAGNRAVLEAIQQEIANEENRQNNDLKMSLEMASYLLSIKEVREFALAVLGDNREARKRVDEFASNPIDGHRTLLEKLYSDKKADREIICTILVAVALIFGTPSEILENQLNLSVYGHEAMNAWVTRGKVYAPSSVNDLFRAINNLACTASHSVEAKAFDSLEDVITASLETIGVTQRPPDVDIASSANGGFSNRKVRDVHIGPSSSHSEDGARQSDIGVSGPVLAGAVRALNVNNSSQNADVVAQFPKVAWDFDEDIFEGAAYEVAGLSLEPYSFQLSTVFEYIYGLSGGPRLAPGPTYGEDMAQVPLVGTRTRADSFDTFGSFQTLQFVNELNETVSVTTSLLPAATNVPDNSFGPPMLPAPGVQPTLFTTKLPGNSFGAPMLPTPVVQPTLFTIKMVPLFLNIREFWFSDSRASNPANAPALPALPALPGPAPQSSPPQTPPAETEPAEAPSEPPAEAGPAEAPPEPPAKAEPTPQSIPDIIALLLTLALRNSDRPKAFLPIPVNLKDLKDVTECTEFEGALTATTNYMKEKTGNNALKEEQVQNSYFLEAIAAGSSRLREDYGTARVESDDTQQEILMKRRPQVSPFWDFERTREFPRTLNQEEEWHKMIWPDTQPANERVRIGDLKNKAQEEINSGKIMANNYMVKDNDKDLLSLAYCVSRGLCASRPPHHVKEDARGDKNNRLVYSFPTLRFPIIGKYDDNVGVSRMEMEMERAKITPHGIELKNDLVEAPSDTLMSEPDPYVEPQKNVRWAPAEVLEGINDSTKDFCRLKDRDALNKVSVEAHVASCVVYETAIDLFKSRIETEADASTNYLLKNTYLGCIAAAKVKQLRSFSKVFENMDKRGMLESLTPPYLPSKSNPDDFFIFSTIPVALCKADKYAGGHSVLYPCNPGLATFLKSGRGKLDASKVKPISVLQDDDPNLSQDSRNRLSVHAMKLTPFLRHLLGRKQEGKISDVTIPIYVANPPYISEFSEYERNIMYRGIDEYHPSMHKPKSKSHLPPIKDDFDFFNTARNCLRSGIYACENLEKLACDKEYIKQYIEDKLGKPHDAPDAMARARRTIIWNDALREACVSGDRLFAFVRQLSGVINEQVDAVCVIDENLLIQQQNKMRERRSRISERAAQEHIQLVKSVFTAVMKDSGLVLGIEKGKGIGDIANLKVVSNTLRKQVSELAQGQGQEGFFGNSVRMEQLLANGTGEITLQELFNRLQDVGKALQKSVAMSTDEDPSFNSSTMDFLSAPRNSMMLRYKPEALAAIRQAFEIFQREFATRYGVMQTPISAFELMEGNDDSLTTYFATFCGHMMVHSRMFGSNTAMYIGMWPAAANANALKISLERLCRAAFAYRSTSTRPNFLEEDGREKYFERAASRDTRLFFASAPSGPGWDRRLEPTPMGYLR
jgi:DNA-binding transcriptional regulator YiaG